MVPRSLKALHLEIANSAPKALAQGFYFAFAFLEIISPWYCNSLNHRIMLDSL